MTNKSKEPGPVTANVSVIIPTWNRAQSLLVAIQSALTQTGPPLEVLVCDDGSSDNSEQAVASLADSHVRWIAGAHTGRPAVPRNRGLEESRGEWIAFLDSDDEWLPDKLETQITQMLRLGVQAASTNAFRRKPCQADAPLLLERQEGMIKFDDLLRDNPVVCSSVILHRSLLGVVKGFPEGPEMKALEDYALWLRVATQTDFVFTTTPFVNYYDAPETSIRAHSADYFSQNQAVFANFLRWAESDTDLQHSDFAKKIRDRYNRLPWEHRRAKLRHWAGTAKRKMLG